MAHSKIEEYKRALADNYKARSNDKLNTNENVDMLLNPNDTPSFGESVLGTSAHLLDNVGTGGSSAVVQALATMGTMGVSAMGSGVESSLMEGHGFNESTGYGILEGGKEALTEYLGGKYFGSSIMGVFGKGASKTGTKQIVKSIANEALGEGLEETMGDLLEPLIQKATIAQNDNLGDLYVESIKQMPMDFITGALTGAIMNGGVQVRNISQYGVDGTNALATVQEANEIVQEIVKLEKEGRLGKDAKQDDLDYYNDLKKELGNLYNNYETQMKAVNDKYGIDSKKAQKLENSNRYMQDINTASSQDLAIRESISKFSKKNVMVKSYNSLSQEDFTNTIKEIRGNAYTESDSSANAFITSDGQLIVNKDSQAYKSGKLYNTIGHEVIHTIEGTEGYNSLYNNFVKGLSTEDKNAILKEYAEDRGYGNQSEQYLLEEAFADYIGENIVVNYKEFSKMLGTNSKWSKIMDKIKGYRGVLTDGMKKIQGDVTNTLKSAKKSSLEGAKASKIKKTKAIKLTSYENNVINRAVRKYLDKIGDTVAENKIVRLNDTLFLVEDMSIDEDGNVYANTTAKLSFEDFEGILENKDIEDLANAVEEEYNEANKRGKKKTLVQIYRSIVRERKLEFQHPIQSDSSSETLGENGRDTGTKSSNNGGRVSDSSGKFSRNRVDSNDNALSEEDHIDIEEFDQINDDLLEEIDSEILDDWLGELLLEELAIDSKNRRNRKWLEERQLEKERKKDEYDSLSDEQKRNVSLKKSYLRDYRKLVTKLNEKMSSQQKEFFKNSVIKNKDGLLIPMFHGTEASDMYFFDGKKIGKNGTVRGHGFYLTNNLSYAESYAGSKGKVIMAFVNIKKPLSDWKQLIPKSDIKRFIRNVVDKTGDDWLSNYGDVYSEGYQKVLDKAVDSLFKYNHSDAEIIESIFVESKMEYEDFFPKLTELLGYDGVVYDRAEGLITLAFNSNQIKDIENKKPTSNPDIRFSKNADVGTSKTRKGFQSTKKYLSNADNTRQK